MTSQCWPAALPEPQRISRHKTELATVDPNRSCPWAWAARWQIPSVAASDQVSLRQSIMYHLPLLMSPGHASSSASTRDFPFSPALPHNLLIARLPPTRIDTDGDHSTDARLSRIVRLLSDNATVRDQRHTHCRRAGHFALRSLARGAASARAGCADYRPPGHWISIGSRSRSFAARHSRAAGAAARSSLRTFIITFALARPTSRPCRPRQPANQKALSSSPSSRPPAADAAATLGSRRNRSASIARLCCARRSRR